MADDITYQATTPATPPSGSVIATDEVGAKHYQRVKLIHGADGVNDGDVASGNPLPTTDAALLTELQIKADPTEQQYSRIYGATGTATFQVPRIDTSTHTLQTIEYEHHEVHSGSKYYIEGHADLGLAATLFVKLVTPAGGKWGHFTWEIGSSGILTATLDEDALGGMAGGLVVTIHSNNRNIGCWTGIHDGGDDNATILTDSTQAWTPDALIGYQVFNSTDGSSGIITDNDGTTVTVAALAGGTGNDWDDDDTYEINNSQMVITSGVAVADSYTQRVSNTKFGSKGAGGQISRADEIILKADTVYLRSFTSGTANNIVNFKAKWYEHTDKTA